MDIFKWIILIEISIVVVVIIIGLYRLIILLNRTQHTMEELDRSLKIINNDLPSILDEVNQTTEEIKSLTAEVRTVVNKANLTVGGALTGVKQLHYGLSSPKGRNLLQNLRRVKTFVSTVGVAYTIFKNIRKFGLIKKITRR
ncbi:MAG: DUF948 domain-containing protein [bacterium]